MHRDDYRNQRKNHSLKLVPWHKNSPFSHKKTHTAVVRNPISVLSSVIRFTRKTLHVSSYAYFVFLHFITNFSEKSRKICGIKKNANKKDDTLMRADKIIKRKPRTRIAYRGSRDWRWVRKNVSAFLMCGFEPSLKFNEIVRRSSQ